MVKNIVIFDQMNIAQPYTVVQILYLQVRKVKKLEHRHICKLHLRDSFALLSLTV